MIKAIIFDCFGVLTTDGWLAFKNHYLKQDQSLFRKATELNEQVNSGVIKYEEFISEVAKMAGISANEARYKIENNIANDELFKYIKTLKPRYKIGMLSNAASNWLDELFAKGQVVLFDAIVLSYESGVIKPEEQSYQAVAERLDAQPNECVFIDDQEKHCEGARTVGMQAILYRDFDQMKTNLEAILKS